MTNDILKNYKKFFKQDIEIYHCSPNFHYNSIIGFCVVHKVYDKLRHNISFGDGIYWTEDQNYFIRLK